MTATQNDPITTPQHDAPDAVLTLTIRSDGKPTLSVPFLHGR